MGWRAASGMCFFPGAPLAKMPSPRLQEGFSAAARSLRMEFSHFQPDASKYRPGTGDFTGREMFARSREALQCPLLWSTPGHAPSPCPPHTPQLLLFTPRGPMELLFLDAEKTVFSPCSAVESFHGHLLVHFCSPPQQKTSSEVFFPLLLPRKNTQLCAFILFTTLDV